MYHGIVSGSSDGSAIAQRAYHAFTNVSKTIANGACRLVTGGGVTEDGTAWYDAPNEFLVPVRRLSPMIAKRFTEALQKGHPGLFKQIPADTWKR